MPKLRDFFPGVRTPLRSGWLARDPLYMGDADASSASRLSEKPVTSAARPLAIRWSLLTPLLAALLAPWPPACSADDTGGAGSASDVETDRPRRPLDGGDSPDGAEAPDGLDAPHDATAVDLVADLGDEDPSGEPDGVCVPDCAGRVCGQDPNCGAPCGVPCGDRLVCEEGACVPDPTGDPLASLSRECAGFCEALCEFLLECGKDDPTCLQRCGSSARFQALSPAACTEGAQVIGLERCPLWLDCGGRECAIDHMCLEVLPNLSYQCAAICDHTQSAPACTGGASCQTVTDANNRVMSALGMCFRLF
jgi:hypothetical protein